jgi:thymidylate synthase ThyX
MKVELIEYPDEHDWMEVKRRALVTIGKTPINPPDSDWKYKMLKARHSPIRRLMFSFLITDVPSWVSVHLARHVHAQPYVKSQRNDRQSEYDRNTAPQNSPVDMIYDVNAEELMTIANKRLCGCAAEETQYCVWLMCEEAIKVCPEIKEFLVPACIMESRCREIHSCGMTALWFDYQKGNEPLRNIK